MPQRLVEHHGHLPWLGKTLTMLDLSSCTDVRECLDLIRARASTTPPSGWVLAHAARVESWTEPRWPTARELDEASAARPAMVMSFDHHSLSANSAALRAAGFDDASPDPQGGVLVRDARGALTGHLLESAAWKAWAAAPEPSEEERARQIRAALHHLAELGFTECHDLWSLAWLGPLLLDLHRAGEVPLEVKLYAPLHECEAQAATLPRHGPVALVGAKIFTDGTLNSRTAWLLDPYADPLPGMPLGKPMMSVDEIADALRQARRVGLLLAAHAIGDGAVRACLDAAERERAAAAPGPSIRIEHCELIHPHDVPRFAALGAIASVQPCHLLTDIEAIRRSIPDRESRVMPWRSLIDSGLTPGEGIVFGSDCPVVRANAEDSILAATRRRRTDMLLSQTVGPQEAISLDEAWACFGRPPG